MCGIAGVIVRGNAELPAGALERLVDALLRGIDSRGGDATGYAAHDGTRVTRQRASCAARTFIEERRNLPRGTRAVLLHTRFATQGDPAFPENNHPVDVGDVYCVHNGHVSNDLRMMREADHTPTGRVDSEAIPAAVNFHGWENAGDALASIEGAAAVALLRATTGEVILARAYASPLVVVETPTLVVWASTREAITRAWSEVLGTPPRKGKFHHAHEGELIRYDAEGAKVETSRFEAYEPPYRYVSNGSAYWTKSPEGAWTRGTQDASTTLVRACDAGTWDDAELVDDDGGAWSYRRDDAYDVDAPTGVNAETFGECYGCGDWFPDGELFEFVEACPVCYACEAQLSKDLATPTGLVADELAEELERR